MSDTINTKITVKDFLNWLEGVQDMQEDNWVPDAKQWNKILEKIYDIDDSLPAKPVQHQGSGFHPTSYRGAPQPSIQEEWIPAPATPAIPAGSSQMPRPVGIPNVAGPISTGNSQVPVKTPNVDGNYDTPFV